MRQRIADILRDGNRIRVVGSFRDQAVRRFLSVIAETVDRRGYEDVVLDLSGCTGSFASAMLPICAHVLRRRKEGIDFALELPGHGSIRNLFLNTNWANFIDPTAWDRSTYAGHIHLPATQYFTATEQHHAVDALVNALLGSVPDLTRSDFAAIEWALNEIADNVLVHAQSPIGGLIQVTTFKTKNRRVDFVVADAGLGIPTTMRTTHPELVADSDALFQAIREGVTRDKSVGQGNGLYGTLQICRVSRGTFSIGSGQGLLYYNEERGVHARREQLPFPGTVVAGTIDTQERELLEKALRFGGKPIYTYDYIEKKFETEDNRVVLRLTDLTASFGSRLSGNPVRTKIENLLGMYPDRKIYVDFEGVPVLSSSFADEVFGKLFLSIGPVRFINSLEFLNLTDTARSLIDRALGQRMATGI